MRLVLALALGALLTACPTPQSPKGPPPEYEEPPAPSWLDSGAPPAPASPDASSPAPAAAGAVPPQYID